MLSERIKKHKQLIIWLLALALGAILGLLGVEWINRVADFVAAVFTRLFQFVAVPTIAIAILSTLATFGKKKGVGKIFSRTMIYTLLTTFCAALIGMGLYLLVAPGNLPPELIASSTNESANAVGNLSYLEHILSVIPNNIIKPFSEGSVLSILLISVALGTALAHMPETENKATLIKGILGLQELLFTLIRALIWCLPVGIVAFTAQLSAYISTGLIFDSLGKYVAVILIGNAIQFFVVLPLFLLARKINPFKVFKAQGPALMMALFTKSSVATLPMTMQCAESRLGVQTRVSRFVFPICTTINMNGCAAFILVTSLFVMQNGGTELSIPIMFLWVVIAVFSAIGNAGVPMGCYFLTLSLMSGQNAPLAVLGLILPIYTFIDMIETTENVWSDSCVCAMTNHNNPEEVETEPEA